MGGGDEYQSQRGQPLIHRGKHNRKEAHRASFFTYPLYVYQISQIFLSQNSLSENSFTVFLSRNSLSENSFTVFLSRNSLSENSFTVFSIAEPSIGELFRTIVCRRRAMRMPSRGCGLSPAHSNTDPSYFKNYHQTPSGMNVLGTGRDHGEAALCSLSC